MRVARTRTPIAWCAFTLCLLLTVAVSVHVAQAERDSEKLRFAVAAMSARDRIEARMASYVAVLRSSAGLLSRPQPLRADEFRVYVERLALREHYPGTQGLGYIAHFGAVTVDDATARAHADGWTSLSVWPPTPLRADVNAVVLIEPPDERNRAALGFDMGTEATRREAMDRARDRGDVALSGKVTLVQEIEVAKQSGFLLFSPVYEGGAVPPTVAERRAKLKGYAYAPLRAGDLFEGIFAGDPSTVAFEVYDGDDVGAASRLYASRRRIEPTDDVSVERIAVGGGVWTARFVPAPLARATIPLALVVAALGAVLSVVVLFVTRARERALARELRATADAMATAETLRLKQMFVGILGHDLRAPLSAVQLSAEVLRLKNSDPATLDVVARIRASTDRMARMIDQVLDLTRGRLGGGIAVTAKQVELGALVRDVADEIVRANPRCLVEVRTSGELDGAWDADRLAQVFSNLLGNAVRYCLDAPVGVMVDGTLSDRVVVSVHNAGNIAPDLLPVVFDAFRGRRDRRRDASGLGLGLYITRAIVEAHGGTIDVVSSEAEGTMFTMVLPRRLAEGAVEASPVTEPSSPLPC
jgi:signal transduction histidine kinase